MLALASSPVVATGISPDAVAARCAWPFPCSEAAPGRLEVETVRCAGAVVHRRVSDGDTMTMASVGVLACRRGRNFPSHRRGEMRLAVPMLEGRAWEARGVAVRCAGAVFHRRVSDGDTMTMASVGVLACRRGRNFPSHRRGEMRLAVPMLGGRTLEARGVAVRCAGAVVHRRVSDGDTMTMAGASVGVLTRVAPEISPAAGAARWAWPFPCSEAAPGRLEESLSDAPALSSIDACPAAAP